MTQGEEHQMKHRKHGTRLLGLLAVAALGVLAFTASAEAVAPGFLINKKAVGGLLATAEGVLEGVSTMLVPGLNFQLRCRTLTTNLGAIESNTDVKAVLLFGGCTALSITKFPEEIHCHVAEPLTAETLILPAELKKPTLDAPAVLAEKVKGLVKLHLPEASLGVTPCVLPLDNTITGEVCFEIKNATNDTVEPLVYTDASVECLERAVLEGSTEGSGVKDVLKYGAQTMTLDGAAKLFLTGAHKGLTLGVSLF
jgi:hypothetical protein